LLRDEDKEIMNSFEFVDLYKHSQIKPIFPFYNMFVTITVKSAIQSGLRTQHLIKTKLKKVFNEEMQIEDDFQKKSRNTKIKFSLENKVCIKAFIFNISL
jgi:hypothetical protein